jgi:gas vesicle protein
MTVNLDIPIVNRRLPRVDVRGAVEGARKAIEGLLRTLGDTSGAVAVGTERAAAEASLRARQLGKDVDSTIRDVRSLRISRDRGRDPWPGVALIMGAAAGVVAMFLFDPRDGRRRRTVLRDKLGKWGRQASREARVKAADLRNRSEGMVHQAKSALGAGQTEDQAADYPTGVMQQATGGSDVFGESRESVGVPVGSTAGPTPGAYTDWSGEPGRPNGRETSD